MKRLIVAAVLALGLAAGSVSANGWGPGSASASVGVNAQWGQGGGGGQAPGVLGPWYLYWPFEAHFATPAHPQFPYWPSAQTLPGGQPAVVQPSPASYPAYWQ